MSAAARWTRFTTEEGGGDPIIAGDEVAGCRSIFSATFCATGLIPPPPDDFAFAVAPHQSGWSRRRDDTLNAT